MKLSEVGYFVFYLVLEYLKPLRFSKKYTLVH